MDIKNNFNVLLFLNNIVRLYDYPVEFEVIQ